MAKKVTNKRCPLQMECERKCEYECHELDCDYYAANAFGEDRTIRDQEERRREIERRRAEEDLEAALAEIDDDEVPTTTPEGNGAREKGQLVNIPVTKLFPHQDNPRKDIGDLTELADSIKANGILQNLTVVPASSTKPGVGYCPTCALYLPGSPTMCKEDHADRAPCKHWQDAGLYTVVIGHRRLAAAKLAGVEEVPCVISEMDYAEQVRTMMIENMQRSDLTVYEQAQGFQMMLDLGDSVEDIAQKSGFSQTTVRRRVKLLELDQEKFKSSVGRGATLQDYMKLDEIEDSELKNEVLEHVGTNNFQNKLQAAIDREKKQKYLARIAEELSAFAVEKTEADSDLQYVKCYGYWNGENTVERPDDAGSVKYFYKVGSYEVDLYRERTEKIKDTEAEERRARVEVDIQRRKEGLWEATARAFRLRRDFILHFNAVKKRLPQILKAAGHLVLKADNCWMDLDYELLSNLLRIECDCENDEFPMDVYDKMMDERPEYTLLATLVAATDSVENGYCNMSWNSNLGMSVPTPAENEELDDIYTFLHELGYEMSDEEKALQDGTHELFSDPDSSGEDSEEKDPCDLCKSAHPFCDECCASCEEPCNAAQTCSRQAEE